MSETRQPAAFGVDPPTAGGPPPQSARRPPRAVDVGDAVVVPAEIDVFDQPPDADAPVAPPKRRPGLGAIFVTALGVLVSLAVGLWTDRLIRDLFQRSDWLGWFAAGVAAIAGLALAVILFRELWALSRLRSVETIRADAADAVARDDPRAARRVVDRVAAFVAARPETAAGRRALAESRDDIIDGAALVRLAESDLLAPLDQRATVMILDAAKRVSVVTAVSPRAVVDLAYVVFESGRLIRRLSELYGGRPGALGFIRLLRSVFAHLAVTGSIAAGDSFIQQIVGHGLAARLSQKLGEGVVNGMMTARIGIAAMEAARPLPFSAVRRPGAGEFLSALASFAGSTRADRQTPPA